MLSYYHVVSYKVTNIYNIREATIYMSHNQVKGTYFIVGQSSLVCIYDSI